MMNVNLKKVANATKLAYQDNVHVIIGSSCSSVTLPMVPVITKAKVPQIIPHSTSSKSHYREVNGYSEFLFHLDFTK